VADQLGLTTVMWDVAPKDWTAPGADEITERVVGAVQPGSIVLFHDHGPGTSDTIAALPGVIRRLRDDGVSFVELGACLVPQ
jgi:peptidoglycan/xylan/chitin deacetylase (PgdA/CDA1 family)